MRPQKAASEEVLRAAAAGAKQPELWQHTGDMGHAASGMPGWYAEGETPNGAEQFGVSDRARRGTRTPMALNR